MTFQEALENPAIEKHPMVVIRARVRVTGWEEESTFQFSVPFTKGYVTRVWNRFDNADGFEQGDEGALAAGEFFYDHANRRLYVSDLQDPDDNAYAGLTVEFEIPIADYSMCAPRDPLDPSSEYVEWHGGLREVPMAQNGSSDSLYGFYPLNQSAIAVLNGDGELNELLYDCTVNFALTKAYIIVDHDAEKAMIRGMIRNVFLGYINGLRWTEDLLQFSCTDFMRFFDRSYSNLSLRFDLINFPNVEPHNPNSQPAGKYEWYVRRVLGMKDGFRAVNIDYAEPAATNNNRIWVTHLKDGEKGSVSLIMDASGANTATRTYFLDDVTLNVGDWIRMNHATGVQYVEVEEVNRAAKYIEHANISRTVAPSETIDRSFIGRIIVQDSVGQAWWLRPFLDFTELEDTKDGVTFLGFTMADNWESTNGGGFTDNGGVFDPSKHEVCVRVYGTKDPLSFPSAIPVSAISPQGGIAAAAVDILYRIIRDSGFDVGSIDENTFGNIGDDSHALGLVIPPLHDQISVFPTYKDMVAQILDSMLWRLSFVDGVGEVKLGLVAVGPFVAAADYEADEDRHRGLDFVHDYADIYRSITLAYAKRDEVQILLSDLKPVFAYAESGSAADLHFSSKEWGSEILQYDQAQAQKIADRLSYALGDRRGLYKTVLDVGFVAQSNLGASIDLIRQRLPGFPFQYGENRARQLMVIEVQKSTRGVSITLEDQKGIQDHSGEW